MQRLSEYLQAKVEADDGVLSAEGAHGFWELSIHQEHHSEIRMDRLAALVQRISSTNLHVGAVLQAKTCKDVIQQTKSYSLSSQL